MANKVTLHFRNDRADRATYIAQTVGFGNTIRVAESWNKDGMYHTKEITETGVVIIRSYSGTLITMFIARPEQLKEMYEFHRWGRVPAWLMTKAKKNWQKGYTKNQPDYH